MQKNNVVTRVKKVEPKAVCHFVVLGMVILVTPLLLCGCKMTKQDTSDKKEIDYTVADYDDVPKEVQQIVEDRKEEVFKTSYTDMENTYIIIGYGKQNTEGYSIQVEEVSESTTDVFVKTMFKGPENQDEKEKVTYPFIIIQIEYTDKNVNVM